MKVAIVLKGSVVANDLLPITVGHMIGRDLKLTNSRANCRFKSNLTPIMSRIKKCDVRLSLSATGIDLKSNPVVIPWSYIFRKDNEYLIAILSLRGTRRRNEWLKYCC